MDVRKLVLTYLDRQAAFKQAESDFNRFKKEFYGTVRDFMGKKGKSSFVFQDSSRGKFSVSDVRPKKVVFDTEKMHKVLSKDVCEAVMTAKYHVDDWEGFMGYMRKLGADEALLMSFMQVEESVDQKALDSLVDSGKLTMENLEGCYEVKVSDGYIKVTEMET